MSTTSPNGYSRKRRSDDTNEELSTRSSHSIRSGDRSHRVPSSHSHAYLLTQSPSYPNDYRQQQRYQGPDYPRHNQYQRLNQQGHHQDNNYRDRGRERVSGNQDQRHFPQDRRGGSYNNSTGYSRLRQYDSYNRQPYENNRRYQGNIGPGARTLMQNVGQNDDQHFNQLQQQLQLQQQQQLHHFAVQPEVRKSKEDLLKEIEHTQRTLEKLAEIQSIDEIRVIDSRWGVKPKGFEKVSAPRAKLSGLFPLPGYPRPVDFTKLEGLVKDRLLNSNDILNEVSKIDPGDSRAAKTLIVENIVDIDYLKIVEFFNDYLKRIDFEQSSSNNIHNKRKLKDNKTLVIEFNNSECATIIYSLNETQLLFNAYKRDDVPRKEISEKYKLSISRPREYAVQDDNYGVQGALLPSTGEIHETVKDSPRKIALLITPSTTSDQVMESLEKIAPLHAMQYYRQKGTREPLGLVFLEFKKQNDGKNNYNDNNNDIIEKLKRLSFVTNAFYACGRTNAYVQNGSIDYNTIPRLVRADTVQPQRKSNVIQILNALSTKELVDDALVQFATKDIRNEASKHGTVKSIKIPRPTNDLVPGLQQFKVPGVGKVYIEFDDQESALRAIMEISGRLYNDRTVLATYFDADDYSKGLL